jgi:hypothetical protein
MGERGIYNKYDVRRTDGSSDKGRKHEHCAYFVLDLECDEFALAALAAYAKTAAKSHPELARDIREIIAAQKHQDALRCSCRESCCPHSLGQSFAMGASQTAHELMAKENKRGR